MNKEVFPRESFMFYRSFIDALKELPDNEAMGALNAVCAYALDGIEPQLKGGAKIVFTMAKPQIDANTRRYVNGCKGAVYGAKGGAPAGNNNARKTTPKQPHINPKTTPNDNVNVNDNDNVNKVMKSAKRFSPPLLDEVSNYISENNFSVNANSFVNFYQSKDWFVGSNKMKDWKAAVRTWNAKEKSSAKKEKSVASPATSVERNYDDEF